MQSVQKIPISGSKITITSTAASLENLIRTASGTEFKIKEGLNAVDIFIEGNSVRWFDDKNIPTEDFGHLLNAPAVIQLRGTTIKDLQMIRSGSLDAIATVRIGHTTIYT